MIKYIITIYIVSLIVIGQVYSQTVELQPDSNSSLHVQAINKTEFKLMMNAKTNVQIKHFSSPASSITSNGHIIEFNNQLLKKKWRRFSQNQVAI